MDGKNKALYFLQMIENENDPCVIQPHQATGTIEGLDKELTAKKEKALRRAQDGSEGYTHIDSHPEGEGFSFLQAEPEASKEKDLTLSIVISRIRKTELRLRNMKAALAGELNTERRERLQKGIAEYEIRLDELKRIEAAAAGN